MNELHVSHLNAKLFSAAAAINTYDVQAIRNAAHAYLSWVWTVTRHLSVSLVVGDKETRKFQLT